MVSENLMTGIMCQSDMKTVRKELEQLKSIFEAVVRDKGSASDVNIETLDENENDETLEEN